ncbi:MAG TPA: GIY-YIG nuclease family protein [Afipia sp.]
MFYVYILASARNGTLYVGMTNNVTARLELHRLGHGSEFVKKYGVYRLVYIESHETAADAILREKRIKKWNRAWKLKLIEQDNPDWQDLSQTFFRKPGSPPARGRRA